MRKEWKLLFASSGTEALKLLESHSVDALISDMRMPAMSGDVLVQEWRDRHPNSLRIGLSGFSEAGQLVSASAVFHQFWNKPCSSENITERLRLCFEFGDRLPEDCRNRLQALINICISSSVLREFTQELSKSEPDLNILNSLVQLDLGLFCVLGKLLNTNFLGKPRDVFMPSEILLLADRLLELLESQELLQSCQPVAAQSNLSRLAQRIAQLDGAEEVLQRHASATARLSELRYPLHEVLGVEDPELLRDASAYLAAIWGFPRPVCEALSSSPTPQGRLPLYLELATEVVGGRAGARCFQRWSTERGISPAHCFEQLEEELADAV